jgi:hypothetical protein
MATSLSPCQSFFEKSLTLSNNSKVCSTSNDLGKILSFLGEDNTDIEYYLLYDCDLGI